jgi:MFS superfamily sulfate permease-like transporter
MQMTTYTPLQAFRRDLLASLVVFLVALPLCMGIAVASGMPPGAGLITGIVGGLVVGFLAGCPLQVSGPAAGLSVIVWDLLQTHGAEKLGIIILAAGVIQICAAWLQLGQWFRAVSPAVIHGMLAGIGALIFASQFHVMIDDVPKGNGLQNLLTLPGAIWKGLRPSENVSHDEAATIGLLTIGVIILWENFAPKKLRFLPPVLLGVLTATAVAAWQQFPINYVNVRDNIFTVIQLPGQEQLMHLLDTSILAAALAVAFIASVETLLSATAVDHLHTGRRTRYNRELLSQGVGNILCGMLSALPMTGVIVRSSANIQAGAVTRASAILHGAWLLLFVAFLPFVLRWIPTASLAAVLVYTGYKLMNLQVMTELREHGESEVLIYASTLAAIVVTNLLTGVLIGVGLAMAKLVYTTQNLDTRLTLEPHDHVALHLVGVATFVSLPRLATALEEVPPGSSVEIKIDSLRHIDHACLHLLESWQTLHETNGGRVSLDWETLRSRTYQTRRARRRKADTGAPPASPPLSHRERERVRVPDGS